MKLFKVNVSVVIFKGEEVLVQKRSANEDIFPGHWGIPGGKVDPTDENLEAGLQREVMEEVGVKIQNIKMIQNNIIENEAAGAVYIVYTADYLSGEAKPLEDTEQVSWMSKDEIEKLNFTPRTKEMIGMAYRRTA